MSSKVAMASWVDTVIRRYGPSLEKLVGPTWMPQRAPAQSRKRAPRFRKYGCGCFGCALPTEDPEVALKVTTDGSEAVFAAAAIRIGSFPRGIVRIYQVAGAVAVNMASLYKTSRLDDAYFLWRENLAVACKPGDFTPAQIARLERVFRPIAALYDAWSPVEDRPDVSIRTHESWARAQPDPDSLSQTLALDTTDPDDPLKRASLEYLMLLRDLEPLTQDPLWGAVAEAVLFYARLGLLLYDIDVENTGYLHADRRQPPVLYDVGLTKILDPRWLGISVSEIA